MEIVPLDIDVAKRSVGVFGRGCKGPSRVAEKNDAEGILETVRRRSPWARRVRAQGLCSGFLEVPPHGVTNDRCRVANSQRRMMVSCAVSSPDDGW